MGKLIAMKGLPGSGKSTWSKAYVQTHPEAVRINRDELRLMLKAVQFDNKIEDLVSNVQDCIMDDLMAAGHDVVLDNTNLNPKIATRLRHICDLAGYDLEWKDFTDVPLSECIRRDAGRGAQAVGKKVITNMHRQFLQAPPAPPAHIPGAPWAVICDIDGTLAHMDGRSPYDASRADEDILDEAIAEIVQRYWLNGDWIILCSGREEIYREVTERWLKCHNIYATNCFKLLMRAKGDNRDDSIVKTELYRGVPQFPLDISIVDALHLCVCVDAQSNNDQLVTQIANTLLVECARIAMQNGTEQGNQKAQNEVQSKDPGQNVTQTYRTRRRGSVTPATPGTRGRQALHPEVKIGSGATISSLKSSETCIAISEAVALSVESIESLSVSALITIMCQEKSVDFSVMPAIQDWATLVIPRLISNGHLPTCGLPRRDGIEGNYNVRFVLDDRDRVVDAWRALGLKTLQCNYGDF